MLAAENVGQVGEKGKAMNSMNELRIRSLISDKEMVTAQANLDLARGGDWRCDYAQWHGQINAEILKLIGEDEPEAEAVQPVLPAGMTLRDYFPDCRKSFIAAMNAAVKSAGYDVEICASYLDKMKREIGGLARNLGVQPHEIWTCYHGGEKPCGECPACKKLESALK
jgi:hypothetical protein